MNLCIGESVMLYLGQMIPKLKSRAGKQGSSDQGQSQSGSGALKKKGKGRRWCIKISRTLYSHSEQIKYCCYISFFYCKNTVAISCDTDCWHCNVLKWSTKPTATILNTLVPAVFHLLWRLQKIRIWCDALQSGINYVKFESAGSSAILVWTSNSKSQCMKVTQQWEEFVVLAGDYTRKQGTKILTC